MKKNASRVSSHVPDAMALISSMGELNFAMFGFVEL
jgi:hypothetical protein